jgi:tRNA dimethylallyltransferase
MREKLLVVVGPTAVGKSELAIKLAQRYNGEIISGDSIQVYKGLDIGTAKIKPEQMDGIVHHLIDIHEPDYYYSVADFQTAAQQLITEINQRGRLPIIVGGTGLYIKAITENYQLPEIETNLELRQQLAALSREELYADLLKYDPETAERLHINDQKRVIRALEIYHQLGKPLSQFHAEQKIRQQTEYHQLLIGLTMERSKLYERINQRVNLMIEQGLVTEVEMLKLAGFDSSHNSMQGIGYKEMLQHLAGELTLTETVAKIQQATRNFAKRQLSLFRANPEIKWFDLTNFYENGDSSIFITIYSLIDEYLK